MKGSQRKLLLLFIVGIFLSTLTVHAQSVPNRAELEAQLKVLEAEIAQHKDNIKTKQQEAVGLQRDVSILGSKINESQAKIKAQNIKINNISGDIQESTETIQQLTFKTKQQKESLAQILRKKNELDSTTFVEFALSKESISDFFSDDDSFASVQMALGESFVDLTKTKAATEEARESLLEKKDQEMTLKELQEIEKKKTEQAQNLKAQILRQTKGQEAEYKKVLSQREKDAASIRTALFSLRDGTSLQFGTLYDFAKKAGASTNIRPEFIMAILSQETNLGTNVGQCFLRDSGGVLVSIRTGEERGEMRPNSVQPFLDITAAVGRDPYATRVSCAFQGWGGAMGISQFMPATWLGVKKRIETATGAAYADPWNNYHAILATALYLRDLGAGTQEIKDERNAACRYYSGRTCAVSAVASSYANSVMRKEADILSKIDVLQGN